MKKLIGIAIVLLATLAAAQDLVTVTATNIQSRPGVLLPSGQITFQPANSDGASIGYRIGGAGQVTKTPVVCTIVAGVITGAVGGGTCQLANTDTTSPLHVCFRTTVKNAAGIPVLGPTGVPNAPASGYECLQPAAANSWCTAAVCNFDTYNPLGVATALQSPGPTGPAGPTGPTGPTGTAAANSGIDITKTSPPANPASGHVAVWADSVTGQLSCKKEDGSGCLITGSNFFPGLTTFGDSITCSGGATVTANGYAPVMAPDFGGTFTNRCRSGDQAADLKLWVYPNTNPGENRNVTSTVLIGTNDVTRYGSDANRTPIFQTTLNAAVNWLATPSSVKILGQDAAVTKTGTWTNDNSIRTGLGIKSNTNGDTLAFSITTFGGPIYLGYWIADSNGGVASVTVDGSAAGTLNAFGAGLISTQNATVNSVALFRYPVAAGTHAVVITVTSATSGSNVFSFQWAGTPPSARAQVGAPRVYVGGVIKRQSDSSSALTSQYDGYVQSSVATLATDGLSVFYVPTRSYVNTTTDMFDTLHPNDAGHGHLRDAFEASILTSGVNTNTGIFNAPITVSTAAPANASGYSNFNGQNLASSTSLNQGVTVYNFNGNSYGMDIGFISGAFITRLFAPSGATVGLCFAPTSSYATTQSDIACPLRLTGAGFNLTSSIVTPLKFAIPAPSDTTSYNNLNGANLASTTALNDGVTVYNNSGNSFGMDLGWDTGLSRYMTRIFASDAHSIGGCFHPNATYPTGQASFTCPFKLTSTLATLSVPLTATTVTATTSSVVSGANGQLWTMGQASELLTLSTSGATTDTSANLLPANAIIESVVVRITNTITTATNWAVGDSTTSGRFCAANSTLTSGTTSACLVHIDQTGAAGPRQTSAAKVRITTTGTPGAGAIRITVFYRQFTPPTS